MEPVPRSGLERSLARGFAVTLELVPPRSADPEGFLARAREVRGLADAYNVTDSPRAQVRMGGLAAATLLLQEGLEPVLQVTARDRNRIALQADLLGAHALGVRNIVALRGDPPAAGGEPNAVAVNDWTTEEFLAAAHRLRTEGRLAGGRAIESLPRWFLGATASPGVGSSVEASIANLHRKVDAGADFVQTQPVFDTDAFADWMAAVRKDFLHDKVHVLAGLTPLTTAKAGRAFAKVPGTAVPEGLIARLAKAADPLAEGVRVARETLDAIRGIEGVRGVHMMPYEGDEAARRVLGDAGLSPRPREV